HGLAPAVSSPGFLMPGMTAAGLSCSRALASLGLPGPFHALTQRVHQIDDVGRNVFLRPLDLLPFLFLLQQVLERIFISIFKFIGLEMSRFGIDDMRRKIEHILW